MTGREGRVDRTRLGIARAPSLRGKPSQGTADARTTVATIDAHGIRAAVNPLLTQPRCEGRNVRLVLEHKHVNPRRQLERGGAPHPYRSR